MLMGGRRLGAGGLGPDGAKQCPACDESVAAHAVACRHCGASLTTLEPAGDADPPRVLADDRTPPRRMDEEADATERRVRPRGERQPEERQPAERGRRPRGDADPVSEWNVPHDARTRAAPPDAQWSESDFERISQTAGLPREDPRTREPRRRHTGFRPWRRQAGATPPGNGSGRLSKTGARSFWIVAAVGLAAVGVTAGLVGGRWDAESWISRQYQSADALIRSVSLLPATGDDAASPQRPSGQAVTTTAPPAQSTPDQRPLTQPAPATSGPLAAAPTVVDPRPVAAPPVPAAGGNRSAASARPETSLVPIKPTVEPRPLTERTAPSPPSVPPPALTSDPWSVRDVQRELARLGYYQGGVDGEVGPMTRSAVRQFQVDAGLRPTGRIEPALLTALYDRISGGATPPQAGTTRTGTPTRSQ